MFFTSIQILQDIPLQKDICIGWQLAQGHQKQLTSALSYRMPEENPGGLDSEFCPGAWEPTLQDCGFERTNKQQVIEWDH